MCSCRDSYATCTAHSASRIGQSWVQCSQEVRWCNGKVCLLQAAQSQLAQQARAHSLEQVQLAEKASAQSAEVTHTAAELQEAKSALNAAQAQTAQLQVFVFAQAGCIML